MKIRITADSTCDLSPEYLAAHDVTIIPLTVTMGDRDYTDGIEFLRSEGGSEVWLDIPTEHHKEFRRVEAYSGHSVANIILKKGVVPSMSVRSAYS